MNFAPVSAAVLNLNHPAHIVHWHFITLSLPNLIVLGVMIAVFIIALLAPFPKPERTHE
jgi:hypothetical protein